jgi:hypothetical protein
MTIILKTYMKKLEKYKSNILSFTKNMPFDNHVFTFKTSHHAAILSLAYRFNKNKEVKIKTEL